MGKIKKYAAYIVAILFIAAIVIMFMLTFSEDAVAQKTCVGLGYDHGHYDDEQGIVCRQHIDKPIEEWLSNE